MTEFIGRTGAKRLYSYPEPPRASALTLLARNFATGPKNSVAIGAGVEIPWNAIDVAPSSPSPDVPITPRSSGIVLISGVVTVANGGAAQSISITVRVNGVDLFVPNNLLSTVADHGQVAIPFLAETTALDTPVGVTANIRIFVSGSNGTTAVESEASSIEVQEVPAATG